MTTGKLIDTGKEPSQVPLGYISMTNNAKMTPDSSRRRGSRFVTFLFFLAFVGAGIFAAWKYLPVEEIIAKIKEGAAAAGGGKTAAANATPPASRTLNIPPGLSITCEGEQPIELTGARLYSTGEETPYLRGWIGVATGTVNAHLAATADGADPFKESPLRLRFALATSGPKIITVSADEGGPNMHELEKADGVAEFIYRGGTSKITLTIKNGRLTLAPVLAVASPRQ